jgi:hypothetical protein
MTSYDGTAESLEGQVGTLAARGGFERRIKEIAD